MKNKFCMNFRKCFSRMPSIFAMILSALLFASCTVIDQQEALLGAWENDDKMVGFNDGKFMMINKKASETLSLRGSYEFASEPENAVKLHYEEYMNGIGEWQSLEGTEFHGYTDVIIFEVKDDFSRAEARKIRILKFRVLANGKIYTYRRKPIQ